MIFCKLCTRANRWQYVLNFLLLCCQLCRFIKQILYTGLSVPDSIEDGATTEEPNSAEDEDEEEEEEEPTPVDNDEGRDVNSEEREEDEDEVPQRQSPLSNHCIQVAQFNTEEGKLGRINMVYN